MDGGQGEKYCLGCRYDLRGLESNRCPECGRVFDPADARTWAASKERKGATAILIIIYLIPLALSTALWVNFVFTRGPRYNLVGVGTAIRAIALSACGPLLLLVPSPAASVVFWVCWIGLLWGTRLKHMPHGVHLAFALVWWLIGTIIVGISV